MAKQALLFIAFFVTGNFLSLYHTPLYGLLTYIHVYFNIPSHQYWGSQLPSLRWSFISAIILGISCFFHNDKLTKPSYKTFYILVGYLFLVIFTAFLSPFPKESFGKIYEFLRYVIIFYLTIRIISELKQYEYVIFLIVFEIFNISLLGRSKFSGGRLDNIGIVDAGSSNQFAGLVVIVLCLCFSLILCGNKYIKFGCILFAPFIIDVFIMCGSRGAFLGLFAAGMTIIVNSLTIKNLRSKVLFCSVIGLIGMSLLMSESYKDRLFSTASNEEQEGMAQLTAGRTDVWKCGLAMSKNYPFGAGAGSFLHLSPSYIPPHLIQKGVGKRASHNTYLQALVEQGYLGLILYCSYLGISIQMLRTSKKKMMALYLKSGYGEKKYEYAAIYCIGLQSAIVSLAVTSFSADRLYYEMLYLLGAFAVCLSTIADTYEKEFELQK